MLCFISVLKGGGEQHFFHFVKFLDVQGWIKGEGAGGVHPPLPEMTCSFLVQLVFCKKKTKKQSVVPFLSGAPPLKKNPGSAP